MTMKTNQTGDLQGFLKRGRHRWTTLLGVGLTALSGALFLTPAQAAAPVSLTLKGQWPGHARGTARDVAVQGKYAYVAAQAGGLVIVDVSDPTHPVPVGGYASDDPNRGAVQGVAVAGNYAYLADGYAGLFVIDVSNPTNPQRVGEWLYSWVRDVVVSGGYACVTTFYWGENGDGINGL